MLDDQLILIGVRHHSPACARLVRETIIERRPAYVLVEGPADYNPYLDDLKRPHKLPVAIFSYAATDTTAQSSYSPFCAYSPEWQALQSAWEIGATALFCDLPAWHPDFGARRNRYADPHGLHRRYDRATAMLEQRLGVEGADAVWDTMVEQCQPSHLAAVLNDYFEALRPTGSDDPQEAIREAFMARHAAWALKDADRRPVMLVCGGWHVGGIRSAIEAALTGDCAKPELPEPPAGVRAASFLTPFSYQRLDRFKGYASGMPSPGYYAEVFAHGLDAAADWAFSAVSDALRKADHVVSTADRIAWQAHALALARLRGHRAPLRADILDAALAALMKDALGGPAAWTRSGEVARDDDAAVLTMLRAMRGDAEGKLATGTRQPPLVGDVLMRLRDHDLEPAATARLVRIDWQTATDRPRARTLHQLRIIEAPGFKRTAGSTHADTRSLREVFEVSRDPQFVGGLIEAARWGGELPMAAAACLQARVAARSGDMDDLASALSDGLFAGLFELARSLVDDLAQSVAVCGDIAALGAAARQVWQMHRYGDVFGDGVMHDLAPVCEAIFERILWLSEGAIGAAGAHKALDAIIVLRDLSLRSDGLAIDLAAAHGAFSRILANSTKPPILAGAALGYLIAVDPLTDVSGLDHRIRRFGSPDRLGDFLAGLFALARETISKSDAVLAAIDMLVAGWTDDELLIALPAMRDAFAWFPPREREDLARRILTAAGFDLKSANNAAKSWMRQTTPPLNQAAAMMLEQRVIARLAHYGFDI